MYGIIAISLWATAHGTSLVTLAGLGLAVLLVALSLRKWLPEQV